MTKKFLHKLQLVFNWVIIGSILITPMIILWKMEELEAKITRPIVYQVDNAGGVMVGTITDKEIIDGQYTVTAGGYRFLVTKEQYEAIKVGDEMPDPNAGECLYKTALGRIGGKVYIKQVLSTTWKTNCSNQLTEQEIKKDFDWAWQWAEPVEDER